MGTRSDRGVKSVNLQEDVHRQLKQAALDCGETMEACAESAVQRWLSTQAALSGDPAAYRKLLHSELDRLARVEFDPERVPGSLLIEFVENGWPEGWCWEDAGVWGHPDDGEEPLEAESYYDITGFYLDPQDGGDAQELEHFVREFLAKVDR